MVRAAFLSILINETRTPTDGIPRSSKRSGAGMALQVGYVGSSSHKQIVNEDPDSFIPGTLIRPLNTQSGLQYANPYAYMSVDKSLGSSNYEGLLSSITKRMGDMRGFGRTFFTLAYTYSKTLSDQDAYRTNISSYNQHQFYASSTINVPQRLVLSGGWELPFAHLWSSGPKRLTSGWSLFPIFSAQAGLPVDFQRWYQPNPNQPGPRRRWRSRPGAAGLGGRQ